MEANKQNTLYLTIKQQYFNEIIAGTKKEEYREIKDTTYKKYLDVDENGNPYYDDELISQEDQLAGDIFVYNNGVYPYYPKDSIKFLNLAVGYNKDRDTAIVEISGITFEPMKKKDGGEVRFKDDGENCVITPDGDLCFWLAVFHISRIVEVHRAGE